MTATRAPARWLLAFALSSPARAAAAEPVGDPEVAAKSAGVREAMPKGTVAAEAPPPPRLRLSLEAPTTRGTWKMRVKNEGEVPVRIVADARLLALDVSPRSARAPTRCELPADMRPEGDLGRALVLPGGASYSEAFEPRLYCIGGNKLDTLAPGAIVVGRLGWPPPAGGGGRPASQPEPPFEVTPIDGVDPPVAPLKSIEAAPIAIPDEPTAWMLDAGPGPGDVPLDQPKLTLQGPVAVDAEMPNDIAIGVTLRNEGSRTVLARFRPEALSFDLIGPAGVETCGWPVMPANPVREVFSSLPPHGSETLTVTLSSYCTGHGLDASGLLVVRPRLDTRRSSGSSIGVPAFEGVVIAASPTLVRLHRGAARPDLEPPRIDP
ncbi:MAG: hypothetical protein JOZ69_13595 [Myxococcales bacterium]|nr:hypothetical protein [Myxococcales bacterium]